MNLGLDTMKEKGVECGNVAPTPSPLQKWHLLPFLLQKLLTKHLVSLHLLVQAMLPLHQRPTMMMCLTHPRSLPASSAAQPESKKGTTTIASQMKDSLVDLFESDNEDDVEESGVEGASRATGVQSEWWKYF
jgi:hypothetical protein